MIHKKKITSSEDSLLKNRIFKFNVDNLGQIDKDTYEALLIPDIKSKFFPPFHTRSVNISKKLLEYSYYKDQYPNTEERENEFFNDIRQGAYYEIPSELFIEKYKQSEENIIDSQFFKQFLNESSPYKEKNNGEYNFTTSDGAEKISELANNKLKGAILYCFNAGQGDSNLFITANGNPYIIDTNIYSTKKMNDYIEKIKAILRGHKLRNDYIKGLIITHLHIDHIRGADLLIDSNAFKFDYFITNRDYEHDTIVANRLYKSARKIPNWINSNERWEFREGETFICVKNPDNTTCNSPDINNSSISLCIRDNGNLFYLTGDTGMHILENCYSCEEISEKTNSTLKVSHHGSRTGTSDRFIKLTNPTFAFISAGQHKKFRHPHKESTNILKRNLVECDISKKIKRDVIYISRKSGIIKNYL